MTHGGPTHAENLTLACRQCNSRKGPRTAFEFVKYLWICERVSRSFTQDPGDVHRLITFSESYVFIAFVEQDGKQPICQVMRVVSFKRETAIEIGKMWLQQRGVRDEEIRFLGVHRESWMQTRYDPETRLRLPHLD